MCRDGFRDNCQRCGREITCRDDYPTCEWGCEPEPKPTHCDECGQLLPKPKHEARQPHEDTQIGRGPR